MTALLEFGRKEEYGKRKRTAYNLEGNCLNRCWTDGHSLSHSLYSWVPWLRFVLSEYALVCLVSQTVPACDPLSALHINHNKHKLITSANYIGLKRKLHTMEIDRGSSRVACIWVSERTRHNTPMKLLTGTQFYTLTQATCALATRSICCRVINHWVLVLRFSLIIMNLTFTCISLLFEFYCITSSWCMVRSWDSGK